jgi:hypothetical protein
MPNRNSDIENEILDSHLIEDEGQSAVDLTESSITISNQPVSIDTGNFVISADSTITNVIQSTGIYNGADGSFVPVSYGEGNTLVEYVNSCPREYPGLHPDLHDAYNTLLDSFGDDAISYEVSRHLRDALSSHNGGVGNDEIRSTLLSYFEYLIGCIRNPSPTLRLRKRHSLNHDERIEKNRLTTESDLIAPIGLEYTYHVPSDKTFFRKITCHIDPSVNDAIGLLKVKLRDNFKEKPARIYNDSGLIEICSPVHKTSKDLYSWFDDIDETCKNYKMMPHHRKKGSGGLHMNISYNKDLDKWRETYINFFIMIANYPEINWILNEPSDNRTANSLQRCGTFVRAMYHIHAMEKKEEYNIEKVWKFFEGTGGKSYAISGKDAYHFELRCFEMPRTKQEMQDFLDFADRLLKFCHKIATEDIIIPLLNHPISIFDGSIIYDEKEKTAVKDFNRLLKTIGLDPDRYRKYVKRNFKVRRDHYGKAYLT